MKELSFDFYWKLDSLNVKLIQEAIVDKKFMFNPLEMAFEVDSTFEDGIKAFAEYNTWTEDVSLIISGQLNNERAGLSLILKDWGGHRLIKLHIGLSVSAMSDFKYYQYFLSIQNLISSFVYDTEDEKWQTETRIESYQLNDRSYAHLPKTLDAADRTIIDTSDNYGRCYHVLGIKFLAAAVMSFGELFYKIISKEVLLSFCKENGIEIINEDLLEIHLFDLFKDDIALIRNRQNAFLNYTNLFDKLRFLKENFRGTSQILKHLGVTINV